MAKKALENKFAALVAKRQGEETDLQVVEVRPRVFNDLFGGGVRLGATYSLWGVSGCGKSTVLYQMMESLLKQGLKVVFVDSEAGFSMSLATNFGLIPYIDSGQLVILPIEDLNELLEILKSLEGSGISALILDSLTSTQPYWGEDDNGDSGINLTANFGKKALQEGTVLNYMIHKCRKAKCAGFLVNHARANIVTGFNAKYAPEHRMAGGYAAKHAPSVVVNLQPGKVQVDAQGNKTGVILKFQAEKNRYAKPFIVYEELLNFGFGIDPKHSVISRCFAYEIFQPAMTADGTKVRAGYYKMPDACGGAAFTINTLEPLLSPDVLQTLSSLLDSRLQSELDELAAKFAAENPTDSFVQEPDVTDV